ncbi:MAG: hypothetical protein WA667_14450 [Candidatus Nitrosopolaris sp.]
MFYTVSIMFDGLPLHVDIVEYPEAKSFVAQCLEVPIIMEADTFEKAVEKINLAIKGYFETFPNERINRSKVLHLEEPVQKSGKRSILMVYPPLLT